MSKSILFAFSCTWLGVWHDSWLIHIYSIRFFTHLIGRVKGMCMSHESCHTPYQVHEKANRIDVHESWVMSHALSSVYESCHTPCQVHEKANRIDHAWKIEWVAYYKMKWIRHTFNRELVTHDKVDGLRPHTCDACGWVLHGWRKDDACEWMHDVWGDAREWVFWYKGHWLSI